MTYEAWRISYQSSEQAARAAYAECARLQAKIEQTEKQEPAAWAATDETRTVVEALGMNQSRRFDSPLFLAAGAQSVSSVPDVDALAQFIREVDGSHQLGAGVLAERIAEWLKAAPEAKP